MNPIQNKQSTTSFPVSIPTGLSLETLFTPILPQIDETRTVENLPDLSVYTLYAFNISTLTRNLINSFKYEDIAGVKNKFIYEILEAEIFFLSSFFQENNVPITFYINSYSYFINTYKDKIRKPTTDQQNRINDITSYCLSQAKTLTNTHKFSKDIRFGKEHSVLLFTHIPADLLSYGNFTTLDLLESHTGLIKTRKDWNSKYFPIPNKDMSILPFMEYLLTTFGDRVMFKPSPLKQRIELYDSMVKKGVTPLTSEFSMSFLLKN